MTTKEHIISILLKVISTEDGPWSTADELYDAIHVKDPKVTRQEIETTITSLEKDHYVDVVPVDPSSLSRGFIVRLTIPGRNMWVHNRVSLTT